VLPINWGIIDFSTLKMGAASSASLAVSYNKLHNHYCKYIKSCMSRPTCICYTGLFLAHLMLLFQLCK
jgi:hypothetical protein